MTSLLTIIDHLQTLDVDIRDDDAYTILCDHLRRNNSTLKNLILFYSNSQLQHMLSENTTLLGLKIRRVHDGHCKYITAGLKNNSTLENLCLEIHGEYENQFTLNDFSQTSLKYLEFSLRVKKFENKFIKLLQTILEENSNLKTLIVNGSMFKEQSTSTSDLESFWRVVLQHPSLDKYIFPSSKKLLQARKKIMKELKLIK